MRCPTCARENRAGARFCDGCGGPVGSETAVAAAPAPNADGLRRQATVMFADLSGYTSLNERLDPEEVEAMMSRIKVLAVAMVESCGGMVNQFVGDQVVALFGIPIAHGDDAVRAVRAAYGLHGIGRDVTRAISERTGLDLAFHTAINTGLIVARERDGRDGHYTITGDAINTGARLLGLAGPDEIVVGPATLQLITGHYATAPLPAAELKGKAAHLSAHRVVAERSEHERPRFSFVGRRGELEQLGNVLAQVSGDRKGQAVVLQGEAGIGKSRLSRELLADAAARGFEAHLAQVFYLGSERGRGAIASLVAGLLGLAPGDDEQRRLAVRRAAEQGLLAAEQVAFVLDLLDVPRLADSHDSGLSSDVQVLQQRRQAALVDVMRRRAADRPMLILVEDVHWADAATMGYLSELIAAAAELAVLIVMTARPEGVPVDPGWRSRVRSTPVLTITLGPLREEEARSFLQAFAAMQEFAGLSDETAAVCLERANGHPLFLEQLLLNAEHVSGSEVPSSVHSLVLSRLDRLPRACREIVEAASILGDRFPVRLLGGLLGTALGGADLEVSALEQQNLVRRDGADAVFGHALLREAIYSSLMRTRRATLHTAAAALFGDDDPVMRASHLDRANHPEAAAAHDSAARARIAVHDHTQALALLERGLVLAQRPLDVFALGMTQGEILCAVGRGIDATFAYARALAAASSDLERCRALLGSAEAKRLLSDLSAVLGHLDAVELLLEQVGPTPERAQLHYLRSGAFWALGRFAESGGQAEAAMTTARAARRMDLIARAGSALADHAIAECRPGRARRLFAETHALSSEAGLLGFALKNRIIGEGTCAFMLADNLSVERVAAEVCTEADRIGDFYLGILAAGTAMFRVFSGTVIAPDHVAALLTRTRELGYRRHALLIAAFLGVSLARAGRRSEARTSVREALAEVRGPLFTYAGPPLLGALAMISDGTERTAALDEIQGTLGGDYHGLSTMRLCGVLAGLEASLSGLDVSHAELLVHGLETVFCEDGQPIPLARLFADAGRLAIAQRSGELSASGAAAVHDLQTRCDLAGVPFPMFLRVRG